MKASRALIGATHGYENRTEFLRFFVANLSDVRGRHPANVVINSA